MKIDRMTLISSLTDNIRSGNFAQARRVAAILDRRMHLDFYVEYVDYLASLSTK